MTLEETARVMDLLADNYPWFYKGKHAGKRETALVLWADAFQDEGVDMVLAAVRAMISIKENDHAPTPGEVKSFLRRIKEPEEMTEMEAWGLVSGAAKNALYASREEFDRLPPALQRMVGTPEQLRAYAMMDAQTLESVVGSNFMRSFKVRQRRERELDMLPESLRAALGLMGERMKLPEAGPVPIDERNKNAALRRAVRELGGRAE